MASARRKRLACPHNDFGDVFASQHQVERGYVGGDNLLHFLQGIVALSF
jgi:hypothetical protein